MNKFPFLSAAIVVLSLPTSALAQDSIGIVTGQFNGKDMLWYVTSEDGKSQSDWTDMGPLASVNIFAQPTDDTVAAIKGAFLIGFQVFNLASTPTLATPNITYMQDGYGGMFGSQDKTTITIEEASIEGNILHVKGSFEGELYYSTDHLRTFDTGNPKQVSGQFDVNLGLASQ